jgi:hypothetical protein
MKLLLLTVLALSACVSIKKLSKAPGDESEALIIEAMKKPIEQESGTQVTFSGTTKLSGNWAYFDGHAYPADGSDPESEMMLDFAALLRRDSGGTWQVLGHGFSGDPYVVVHLRRTHPEAPSSLFPNNIDKLIKLWPTDQD